MADLVSGALVGALVGALLSEVIDLAKKAWRCKKNCQNLVSTLNSVSPLVHKVGESSDSGDAACQAWLKDFENLLNEAKCITNECISEKWTLKKTKKRVIAYMKRPEVSSRIVDIDCRINNKVQEAGLLVLGKVQSIEQMLTSLSVASPMVEKTAGFVPQELPRKIVAFEDDPFQKLKALIKTKGDAWDDSVTIGLKGTGGAGKTLIAKMVHNDTDIQEKYGVDSILWNTIGSDAKIPDLYRMMGKSLNNGGIFEQDYACRNEEDQRTYLIEAFRKKKVLLILDDVWEKYWHGRSIMEWLDIAKGLGSVTLVTTRSQDVLSCAKAKETVEVPLLSNEEGLKLFCYHAFGTSSLPSGKLGEIAKEMSKECAGLPLALEVIGSTMWEKEDISDWRIALKRLKQSYQLSNSTSIEEKLFHRLRFSYDELDDIQKKCFLYFAAFPEDCEVPTDKLYSIWHAERLFDHCNDEEETQDMGRNHLIGLADQSMIQLSKDGEVATIHDVLRDLAFHIIREAPSSDWASQCHFQPGQELKTIPKFKDNTKRISFIGSSIYEMPNDVQLPHLEVLLLLMFSIKKPGDKNMQQFSKQFFSSMIKLLYLDLSGCESLKELPESIKELNALTSLHLSWCESLKELPESIKELKALQSLDLSWCRSLKELPESIKELKALISLDLSGCGSLKELPESIKDLKALTSLDLSWCKSLKELPESIKELKALTSLDLHGCESLKELPESIKELKALMSLNLSSCKSLKELPESIKELKALTSLDLSRCGSLKELPESIKELKALTSLGLSCCQSLKELPEGIKELKALTSLDLSGCGSLKELPESIQELKALTSLGLSCCESLKELPESIKELKALTSLNLSWCESLKELPESIKELKALTSLGLSCCESLKELPESIKELKALTSLDLSGCWSLKELRESIKELKALTSLNLSHCEALKELPESIKELKALTSLDLSWCVSLKELPESIKELKALTSLDLSWCKSLKELPESIKELKALKL
jgi:Leucine-rich repeat (LRR) protein